MKTKKLTYTFKSDLLFKMIFVKYPNLLKRLVSVLLEIPFESINEFELLNTEIPPEEIGKKFCRLDIQMDVDGNRVDLEIQVEDEGNYPERSMFYWARIFSSSLPAGDNYSKLPKAIVISILGFNQFDCEEFHSEFAPLEVNRNELLSDKMRFHFFELRKLPEINLIDSTNDKELWLSLFNAETEEELDKLVGGGGEVMAQAVEAYKDVTATEEFKLLAIRRDMQGHDEAQALYNARRKERAKWEGVVAEKDEALLEKEEVILKKDEALLSKETEIELLLEKIKRLENNKNT